MLTFGHSTVNPHSKTHGAPTDENRHVGDLGNIETDAQGNSKGSVTDKFIKIIGPESVIGVGPQDSLPIYKC
jgi:Cu-Zn family superoxide dismutase